MPYSHMRIARLRRKLVTERLDALYIRNLSNIRWLTAFEGVFDEESAHGVLVTPENVFLHTDARYALAMKEAAQGSGIAVDDAEATHAEWLASIFQVKDGLLPETIGIEDDITLAEYRRIEAALETAMKARGFEVRIEGTNNLVLKLRATKDADEVRRIRAAQAITDKAFAHIIGFIRPGMSERAVQIELEGFMVRQGANSLAFPSIVAAGANGASPHAIPGETKLVAGAAVVLDFGACAFGYCSDMTRTIFLGEPDTRMRQAYDAVRQANEEVEAFLKPGVTGAQAQKHAEDILVAAGFGGAMGHSLGHGVGLDVHEEPILATRNKAPLEEGNVVTVEPGVYFKHEFGIRIEDFGIVTHDGFEVFTESSHDMVII